MFESKEALYVACMQITLNGLKGGNVTFDGGGEDIIIAEIETELERIATKNQLLKSKGASINESRKEL